MHKTGTALAFLELADQRESHYRNNITVIVII